MAKKQQNAAKIEEQGEELGRTKWSPLKSNIFHEIVDHNI